MGGLWSTKVTNSCIPFYLPLLPPTVPSPLVSPGRFFLLNCIFLSTIIGPSLVYDDTKFANVKWLPWEFFQSAFGIGKKRVDVHKRFSGTLRDGYCHLQLMSVSGHCTYYTETKNKIVYKERIIFTKIF